MTFANQNVSEKINVGNSRKYKEKIMRYSFLDLPRPIVCAIMAGQNLAELVAKCRSAIADGADGILIDLMDLDPELRNQESLEQIINKFDLPFMFCFYRKDRRQQLGDEARQEVLLAAARAGAGMIDVMGDLFDPSPRELTRDPDAIARQKALIEEIHAAGSHVVISSHTGCFMDADEVLEHLQEGASRGADMVKIVTNAETPDELAETMRTTMILKEKLSIPFIHLCSGKYSVPHRYICSRLGCDLVFAVHDYDTQYSFPQPMIRATRDVLAACRWDIRRIINK